MYNVLKAQNINEDILRTTIFIVEGILNRRRLTPHSDDNEKFETITQINFRLDRLGQKYFETTQKGTKVITGTWNQLKQTQIKSGKDFYWNIYSNALVRTKLFKESKDELNERDLVWIVDPQKFADKLHLGRIVKLNYSEDGISRSAEVKTKTGMYKRPIIRLVKIIKVNEKLNWKLKSTIVSTFEMANSIVKTVIIPTIIFMYSQHYIYWFLGLKNYKLADPNWFENPSKAYSCCFNVRR